MAEISIPLAAPGTRAAVAEKTYNQIYIMDLAINAKAMDGNDSIYAEYVPFDKDTGDRLLTDRREVRVPFWEAVAAIPSAAAAFAAVAGCLPDLIAYAEAKAAAEA